MTTCITSGYNWTVVRHTQLHPLRPHPVLHMTQCNWEVKDLGLRDTYRHHSTSALTRNGPLNDPFLSCLALWLTALCLTLRSGPLSVSMTRLSVLGVNLLFATVYTDYLYLSSQLLKLCLNKCLEFFLKIQLLKIRWTSWTVIGFQKSQTFQNNASRLNMLNWDFMRAQRDVTCSRKKTHESLSFIESNWSDLMSTLNSNLRFKRFCTDIILYIHA